jgi:hypothetical protein
MSGQEFVQPLRAYGVVFKYGWRVGSLVKVLVLMLLLLVVVVVVVMVDGVSMRVNAGFLAFMGVAPCVCACAVIP